MSVNLACYHQNCINPVVGQCAGYNGPCGRFYCSTHSAAKLCGECAAEKAQREADTARQEAIDRLIHEYSDIAEQVYAQKGIAKLPKYPATFWNVVTLASFIAFLLIPVGWIFFPTVTAIVSQTVWWVAGAVLVVSSFVARNENKKFEKQFRESIISKLSTEKPGFREFYTQWLPLKKEQEARRVAEINGTLLKGTLQATKFLYHATNEALEAEQRKRR